MMKDVISDTLHVPEPSRRPARYGVSRDEYVVWSVKSGRECRLFSSDAFQHWLLAEWNPETEALCEYPDSGQVPLRNGKTRQLALWTRERGGRERYFDVLTERDVAGKTSEAVSPAHWPAVEAWSRAHGCTVELVRPRSLDTTLRQRARHLLQLHPFVVQAQALGRKSLEDEVLGSLHGANRVTLKELLGRFAEVETGAVLAAVFILLYRGDAVADLDSAPVGQHLALRRADCGPATTD